MMAGMEPAEVDALYAGLMGQVADGSLQVPVEATYPLSEAAEAVRRFGRGHGPGKIVLTI